MTTNFVQVIKACEKAGGAGTKDAIKKALATADQVAQRLIAEALNPYRVFGVRKFDMPKQLSMKPGESTKEDFEVFFNLLDDLASRKLTGDAARDSITFTLGRFKEEDQEYVARVLDKDLKAGFSADTVNKIFKGLIPTFEVMLADKCEEIEDFEKSITFPCQADFKYDGERTIAIVRGDAVTYYSRSGKEATHVNGLFDDELKKIREYLGKSDFVLDGERYASNFTETMNAKKSGNDEAKKNLRFRAFFLMPYEHWLNQKTTITMKTNRVQLEKILKETGCTKIILSEGREVADYHDMMAYCNEAIDKYGVEGLILKDWNSTYIWDRKLAWCKVKRFYDVDARIVGFYPGRPKSRLENTVGGVNAIGFLESGERVEFNCGSGFSDEQRADMKANPQKYLDATHVFKYQEVSRSKSKAVASLRFPTYEHSRDDKVVDIS